MGPSFSCRQAERDHYGQEGPKCCFHHQATPRLWFSTAFCQGLSNPCVIFQEMPKNTNRSSSHPAE